MYPIQSTALRRIDYDEFTRRLIIEFRKDGSRYMVFGISPRLFCALLAAQPHPWTRCGAQVMRHPKVRIDRAA